MRTLAIGDIHGCYQALKTLEAFVDIQPQDHVITLGDHIHRGPDSRSVVQWLLNRQATGRLTALRGNHECVFQAAIASELDRETWLGFGGEQMLASYNVQNIDQIPIEHRSFLQTGLKDLYENETHFCVHANAREDLELKAQPDRMLFWKKFGDVKPHQSGKIMVCGHTPQRSGYPKDIGHAICIDTAASRNGWLTCLDLDTRFVWQANQAGDTRSFSLDTADRIAV
jgi:serine/threonine protein phosphatase 1